MGDSDNGELNPLPPNKVSVVSWSLVVGLHPIPQSYFGVCTQTFRLFQTQIESIFLFMSCRSLYFYAHIWSVLLILFCRMRGMRPRPTEKQQKDEPTVEMNKNWIDKLEHKGGSAEVNYTKRVKLN